MSYLYLNFIDNLEEGQGKKSCGKRDIYTMSLKEQYELLRRKIPAAPISLQEFIKYMCPDIEDKNYFISMPGFDRKINQSDRGLKRIYNIVIRPETNKLHSQILPARYDVILIGDVTLRERMTDITVKGIELIDSKAVKYGEWPLYCRAACAFEQKTLQGREKTVPDYGTRELSDSVLTNDIVIKLAKLYPVPNPEEAKGVLEKWKKYIEFRKYYLAKQTENCKEITNVTICDSYMVTKNVYRRNQEWYADLLLDGNDVFAKSEQVMLSEAVDEAEPFPLIRVDIERSRKALLESIQGKGKPKFETHLQRYTKEPMGLSAKPPKYDEKDSWKGVQQYLLGECYQFTYNDIEPDCSALDNECKREIADEHRQIDTKYQSIIKSEVERFMQEQNAPLTSKYTEQLERYQSELAEKLDCDVQENKDKDVRKAYEEEVNRKTEPERKVYDSAKNACNAFEKSLKKPSGQEKEKLAWLRKVAENARTMYESAQKKAEKEVSLRSFYLARNERLVKRKCTSLEMEHQAEERELRQQKTEQLNRQYHSSIEDEKSKVKLEFTKKYDDIKAEKIENETIRRYMIYFKPENGIAKFTDLQKALEGTNAKFLVFDNRAEKAKIYRQQKALDALDGGYVKNPFLPSYLFNPKSLKQSECIIEELDWCLESLNDSQKLAVRRALASESIFLLQGPPGTGKTQVIAEITAQLCKRGKKVLISSETHKAIDNVFERLPKIPEIRPLRLIPTTASKETNYSPEKLVDNLYRNISENLRRQVRKFENFEETKANFDDQMRTLRMEYEKLLRLKKAVAEKRNELQNINAEVNRLNVELEKLRADLTRFTEQEDVLRRTVNYMESFLFEREGVDIGTMSAFRDQVMELCFKFSCFESLKINHVAQLIAMGEDEIEEELSRLLSGDKVLALEQEREELRNRMAKLRDPDTDEAPEEGAEGYVEYKELRSRLIKVSEQVKALNKGTNFDVTDTKLYSILPDAVTHQSLLRELKGELKTFKEQLNRICAEATKQVSAQQVEIEKDKTRLAMDIAEKQLEISNQKYRYEQLSVDERVEEYGELNSVLKQKITRFFHDFDIVREYGNMEEAFSIIREEWKKLERGYDANRAENAVKIPMYKEIEKYLSQEDILEEDRRTYTRELYSNVNVFGITCTSRDKYSPAQHKELGEYGIGDIDIHSQGIDVVIVDEVSKSAFLDLLIPILYGKTVILVGDHRQLPPMYDLRHMKKEDFEGLDETIISERINNEYTALYEECFFKTLYENIPTDFRVMLNKQYRCHSHIMEVFNHFYGGSNKGLQVGREQQDDEKDHGLTVRINKKTIIERTDHVVFVDCPEYESSAYVGSTSKVNEQEANVAITLLKELDVASGELFRTGKFKVDQNRGKDERPSVGIICTYGDQANLITKKRRNQQFKNFSGKQDEKLVISTVDDFQGDERDIIIVSMVRNPAPGKPFNLEFIKKFERINVAFSRARKLLIIVGNRQFLSKNGIIDLPNLNGRRELDQYNFPVYQKIIDTIAVKGKILTAEEILGE